MRHPRVITGSAAALSAAVAGLILITSQPLASQGAVPTRLVGAADLVHAGSFTFPNVQDTKGNYGFEYAQGVIAFNPANGTLFVVGHDWNQQVAEVTIPAPGGVATVKQAFRDPLEGRIGAINPADPNSKKIGGLLVRGDRLVLAAYSYYDGAASATASHFVRSTDLAAGGVQGPFRVGSLNPAFYAGYFADVPPAWQTALGGSLLNGQCCLGVISRTSYGPSISVVNPADLLAARQSTPATMLVGYPEEHQALAGWASTGPLFNGTTIMRGALVLDGTASLLFFGRHGMGPFCYGEPGPCKDPADSGKGTHAYPYEPHVWAYNLNDLAAVRAGRRRPWEVKPYATWRLPGLTKADIGGVTVDPATGRIFVSESNGDGAKLRVHVFTLRSLSVSTNAECSFALSVGARSVDAGSSITLGPGRVQAVVSVEPSAPDCEWTANADQPWLSVAPAAGAGSRHVVISAPANGTGAPRSAAVWIAGRTLAIGQAPFLEIERSSPGRPPGGAG